jgi:hypothetical protein
MKDGQREAASKAAEMDNSGRDKKRIRDRKAQREHRKRQKTYVEGLEAQIEKLSNLPASERSSLLWKENERLRQQVRRKICYKLGIVVPRAMVLILLAEA